jgi:hypothetical protein
MSFVDAMKKIKCGGGCEGEPEAKAGEHSHPTSIITTFPRFNLLQAIN